MILCAMALSHCSRCLWSPAVPQCSRALKEKVIELSMSSPEKHKNSIMSPVLFPTYRRLPIPIINHKISTIMEKVTYLRKRHML